MYSALAMATMHVLLPSTMATREQRHAYTRIGEGDDEAWPDEQSRVGRIASGEQGSKLLLRWRRAEPTKSGALCQILK
jgi:hypothetical protein